MDRWKLLAILAFMAASPAHAASPVIYGDALVDGIMSTLLYGAIGILLAAVSFRLVDALTPGDLKQQLTVEKNVALGVVVGMQALGISIIIAAAIAG